MTDQESPWKRPVHELFGTHSGYGFAGEGVHSASGNFTRTVLDMPMPDGLVR